MKQKFKIDAKLILIISVLVSISSLLYINISRNWILTDIAMGGIALAAITVLFRGFNVRHRLERELCLAKKQAAESALVKERFMINMNHELLTPMNGILGFSSLLQKTPLDKEQNDYVSAIKTSGANLLSTINSLLNPSPNPVIITPTEGRLPKLSDGSQRVLLVEDNLLNQKLAGTYLKSFGLGVDVAGNGQLALDALKQKQYDVILMDIQMPVMDGYNAAMKIRSELNLDTPVIAMTANIMAGEREKCISYGMNDYISKPFKEAELHAIIANYLTSGAVTQTDNDKQTYKKLT